VWEVCKGRRWEIHPNQGSPLGARNEEAAYDVGTMAERRFNMPVGGLLFVDKCNASLVPSGSIGGKDLVPKAIASMDLGRESGLRDDGNVNLLGL
jgi:hypothetical protein